MGIVARYEGTLTGFYSMLAALEGSDEEIVSIEARPVGTSMPSPSLFAGTEDIFIHEDQAAVKELIDRLSKSGGLSVEELCRAYLSGEGVELPALSYCRLALRRELSRLADETDPDVRLVRAASRRVVREVHRFIGILRFNEGSDGAYVARFEPDADILELVLPHFERRFGDCPFLIIDEKRGKAGGTAAPRGPEGGAGKTAAPLDGEWEGLWRVFYAAAENPNRRNEALRRRFIPLRYWKYLPELSDGGIPKSSGSDFPSEDR
jgi:probable DNA metabolism protein